MATIEKMQLCGIRSFGPYQDDIQSVKFSSPLTLFLGENGCGKTTLIEALKFAISGDVPGGSKSGQGFVHDPKLEGTVSTKGQVRLKFADAKSNKYIVCKSVQLIDKGATYQFKRLDSTLKRINPDGTDQTISSRCADIDNDLCDILGVSKAILNNVIFCHQEDAAWPLEEPKKLKERFDEIFGAAEYNKCAENVRKMIKENVISNKLLQSRVSMLKQTADLVDRKRTEMQEKEEKLSKYEEVIKEKEARLVPINTRLREICDLESNLGELQEGCAKKEAIKSSLMSQQNEILKNIGEEYTGSDHDLEKEIASFEINRGTTEEKLTTLEKKKKNIETRKNQLLSSMGRLQVKMGKLQGEKNQHQETITERNRLIEKTAEEFKIQISGKFDSEDDVIGAITVLGMSLESSKTALTNLTRECDMEETELQKLVDTSRDKLAKVNHSITSKEEQSKSEKSKIRGINSQLRELDYSDEQAKNLQAKITRIDGDLQKWKAAFDGDAVSKNINDDKQKIHEYSEKLEILEREHKILQQNSITEAELETQKYELVKRQSEIDKLKNKHFDNFNKIFNDDIPNPGFIKKGIESNKQINTNKINNINRQLTTKQKESTTLETKLKFQKEKLQTLEKELQTNEKQVLELCKGKPFEVVSDEFHQAIEKLQKDKGQFSSAKIMYERFLQKFRDQKPCCPVCQTDFGNNQEAVKEIIATIQSKIKGIPQELKKVEDDLTLQQEQYSKLLQLKPVYDKVKELNSTLIPKLRSDLIDLNSFYERVSKEVLNLTEQLIEPQGIVEACSKIVSDAVLIDQHQLEIHRSQRKITELESQLVKVPSNRSRQQTEAEIEDLKVDITNIRRNCETSQKKLQQHNDRCQELREERSKHVEKQLQLQKAMQGKPQLQDQLSESVEKERFLRNEIDELQVQLNPLKSELKEAEVTKQMIKEKNRKKLNESQSEFNRNQKFLEDINKFQKNIDQYITRNGDDLFEATLLEITNLKTEIATLEASIEEVMKGITEINKKLVSQEAAFRTLKDNLALRQKRKEVQTLTEEITDLKRQIGDHNYRSVHAEKLRLREQDDEYRREINMCTGRNDELKQEIRKLRTELSSPENKQAHTNYKKTLMECKISVKAVEDLTSFVKGLEFGILKFHQERMEEINKIIRHLWRSIYRGNDCDYIEIKTDETKSSGAKRSYNYKVIQKKGDAEIDMRGRCSAGQKVLACLVIRMALAETFSKNCGILALDEPTTNLDHANISSLSDALARIVNNRQLEKNFQLLIITHDEEFLATLRRVDRATHFWRVSRNNKGNSVITREML